MKKLTFMLLAMLICFACSSPTKESGAGASVAQAVPDGGQSNVQDNESERNVVQVAVSSPDHKTLVAALKAAEYVDALSNAGPFTVFAPTDAAFGALPAGTVEDLVKPENKDKLRNILEYHVYVGVIRENMMRDGMSLNQVNGQNIKLTNAGDKIQVNGANVIAVVPTTNGIIYVIDQVLLPPQ